MHSKNKIIFATQCFFLKRWYQSRRLWTWIFLPFSWIYRLIISLRKYAYRWKLFSSTRISCPVVIIGNMTSGGTGKTPFTIWLANQLQKRDFRIGIVSRGYRARHLGSLPYLVSASDDPEKVGDEAVLLAHHTHCPVMISPNRVSAASTLAQQHNCEIILSDDGLQHLALKRDMEIICLDGERGIGNGLCLPAGPLREPPSRLLQERWVFTQTTSPGPQHFHLAPSHFVQLTHPDRPVALKTFQGQRVHAVAGIGNPERFFTQLRALGIKVIPHPFPDHYAFTPEDLHFEDTIPILMTEKDAVKVTPFLKDTFWYMTTDTVVDPAAAEQLLTEISQLVRIHAQTA